MPAFSALGCFIATSARRDPDGNVPGVTSFACISACAAFPLAMEQQPMAVVACTSPEEDLEQALRRHECVVMMKVYGRFRRSAICW